MTALSTSTTRESYVQEAGLRAEKLPRHVAIIMDGNGRWAQQRGWPRAEGHRRGANTVRTILEECCRLGIDQLTLYCLSVENWKRPQSEVAQLMHLLERYLITERPTLLANRVRLKVIGRRERLPSRVLKQIDLSESLTADHDGTTLCLAIDYGGQTELVDAMRQIARQVQAGELAPEAITEATIGEALYTTGMPDPDLLIRTAGERRISNFLLWQISYAEIWVTDVCWPEFGVRELHAAFRDFAARQRRYGGLSA